MMSLAFVLIVALALLAMCVVNDISKLEKRLDKLEESPYV